MSDMEQPVFPRPHFAFDDSSHTIEDLNGWIEQHQGRQDVWYMRSPEEKAQPATFSEVLEPEFWDTDREAIAAHFALVSVDDLMSVRPGNISETLWGRRPTEPYEQDTYRIGRIAFPATEFKAIPFNVKKLEERVSIKTVAANQGVNPLFNEYPPGEDNDKVFRSVRHALERYQPPMRSLMLQWEAESDWLRPLAHLSKNYNRDRVISKAEMEERTGVTIENDVVTVGDMERWLEGWLGITLDKMMFAMRMQLNWSNKVHNQTQAALYKRLFDDPNKAAYFGTLVSAAQAWVGKKQDVVSYRLAEIERIIGGPNGRVASELAETGS